MRRTGGRGGTRVRSGTRIRSATRRRATRVRSVAGWRRGTRVRGVTVGRCGTWGEIGSGRIIGRRRRTLGMVRGTTWP